jgi:hypothetical protein
MTELATTANGRGALASIRRLEQTLATRSTTRTAAEGYVESARQEAASILASAQEDVAEASAEQRARAIAAADRDEAEIRATEEARAADLRDEAAARTTDFVDAAVALIVWRGPGSDS